MAERIFFTILVIAVAAGQAWAQYPVDNNDPGVNSNWRRQSESTTQSTGPTSGGNESEVTSTRYDSLSSSDQPAYRANTRSSGSNAMLPSDAGQVWREYDISAYTTRVTSTQRPEQAVIDWILRETGYEAWHYKPLGILSADSRTLRVYHTPDVQKIVADLVDRFVRSEAATQTFAMRVITLDSPSWRTKAQPLLKPVAVQTPGVCAWLLAKEDAAVLWADLRRRGDYREHSSPYLMVNNGQSTVVSAMRGRRYARDVVVRPDLQAGYEKQTGQGEEGVNIDFSPLLSSDRQMIDATIKCNIDQVEKMIPIMLDVPSPTSMRQRIKIEEPQIIHFRFHERFRWPAEHVLLIGMGMVALPVRSE